MKAKKQFQQIHQESIIIVKKIKLKNDNINKKSGIESEVKLLEQINQDKTFFQHSITKINDNIRKMEANYLDPDSVRKIQILKKQAKKQISRNQFLIKSLIESSFEKIQQKQTNHTERKHNLKKPKQIQVQNKPSPENPNPHTLQIQQDSMDISYYQIQKDIHLQKTKLLKQFQHNILQINDMITQTAQMTYKQGQDLDIIGDQITKTYKNTIKAQEQLEQASTIQKKSRTKYICLTVLILIIIACVSIFYLI